MTSKPRQRETGALRQVDTAAVRCCLNMAETVVMDVIYESHHRLRTKPCNVDSGDG